MDEREKLLSHYIQMAKETGNLPITEKQMETFKSFAYGLTMEKVEKQNRLLDKLRKVG